MRAHRFDTHTHKFLSYFFSSLATTHWYSSTALNRNRTTKLRNNFRDGRKRLCVLCAMVFFSSAFSTESTAGLCLVGWLDGTALFDFHNFFPSLPYDKQVVVCVRSMKDPNTTITTAAAVIQFFFIL